MGRRICVGVGAGWRTLLAQGRLRKPLDAVRVRAYLTDPTEVRQREALKGRLYGWSILLLAAGIVVGAWLVLRQAARDIREARKRSEFVMSLSHDLRTPLASIRAAAGTLMDPDVEWPDEQRREIAASIDREAEWLNRLVTNLLDMSRVDAGELRPSLAAIPLADLVSEATARAAACSMAVHSCSR